MEEFIKREIRKTYLISRKSLTNVQVNNKSVEIFDKLKKSRLLDDKNIVFIYCSFKNEVKTYNIIDNLFTEGKTVIVPCLAGNCNGLLDMHMTELKSISDLAEGPMGIPQPQTIFQPKMQHHQQSLLSKSKHYNLVSIDAKSIDAAIIPGVAFDINHNRIGYGKGMYDKILPYLRSDCLKIALAYEIQITSEVIDNEEHDVKMDYIITENRII